MLGGVEWFPWRVLPSAWCSLASGPLSLRPGHSTRWHSAGRPLVAVAAVFCWEMLLRMDSDSAMSHKTQVECPHLLSAVGAGSPKGLLPSRWALRSYCASVCSSGPCREMASPASASIPSVCWTGHEATTHRASPQTTCSNSTDTFNDFQNYHFVFLSFKTVFFNYS